MNMKRIISFLLFICIISVSFVSCQANDYKKALALIEDGKYEEAYDLLTELGDNEDAKQLLGRFHYVPTSVVMNTLDRAFSVKVTLGENNLPSAVSREVRTGEYSQYTSTYTYDEKCNIVKEVEVGSDGEQTIYDYEYAYDSKGNLIKETYKFDDVQATYSYTYDDNGKLTKKEFSHSSGTQATSEYTYYSGGSVIREDYESNRQQSLTSYVFYDAVGFEIREDYISTENATYTYDNNGRPTKIEITHKKAGQSSYEYIYNDNGLMTQVVHEYSHPATSERIREVIEYSYDEEGKLIKETRTNSASDTDVISYIYDENGNLAKIDYSGFLDGHYSGIKNIVMEYILVYIPYDLSEEKLDTLLTNTIYF